MSMEIIYAAVFFISTVLIPVEADYFTLSVGDEQVSFQQCNDTSWQGIYVPENQDIGTWIISGNQVIVSHQQEADTVDLTEGLVTIEQNDLHNADSITSSKHLFSTVYIRREENQITLYQKENYDLPYRVYIRY
ncbi:MAG: hypothetical protein APR63_09705 [Desulfuromonas sp. SDB]|nr:MAG: hypothetical protein APR63_09705 [Desulfuromonas sp. SDB]